MTKNKIKIIAVGLIVILISVFLDFNILYAQDSNNEKLCEGLTLNVQLNNSTRTATITMDQINLAAVNDLDDTGYKLIEARISRGVANGKVDENTMILQPWKSTPIDTTYASGGVNQLTYIKQFNDPGIEKGKTYAYALSLRVKKKNDSGESTAYYRCTTKKTAGLYDPTDTEAANGQQTYTSQGQGGSQPGDVYTGGELDKIRGGKCQDDCEKKLGPKDWFTVPICKVVCFVNSMVIGIVGWMQEKLINNIPL